MFQNLDIINYVAYLSLAVFSALLIGSIAAYRDFKSGKISNKLIIIGLEVGLILLLYSVLTGALTVNLFWQALLNAAVALVIGYALWYFDFWAAGDAKLFFIFALLLPFRFYWRSFLPVFPSLVILINVFIPFSIFIFLQSLFAVVKKTFLFFKQDKAKIRLEEATRRFFQQIKINYLSYLGVITVFGLILILFQLVRLEAEKFIGNLTWGRGGLFFLMIFLGTFTGYIAKNKKLILVAVVGLALYVAVKRFFYSQNLLLDIVRMTEGSLFYLVGIGLLGWLSGFYEKNSQNKNLHFASWLFFGVILTILINGPLFLLF